MAKKLPDPVCRYGYPVDQVREIMGPRYGEFVEWMSGQTMSICEGMEYDYDLKKKVPTNCGPHSLVVYVWDVERFLRGLPVVD